ncbi:MAG: sodium:proton antiporter, partial [Chromatiaceae bacterium]
MNRDFSLLIGLLAALFGAVLMWVYLGAILADPGPRLADLALELLPRAGMANPATAVLLNYRAYDTLLELVLLFAAILGIWSVGPAHPGFVPAGAALRAMVGWAVPLLLLAAGYMLWVGFDAPGGA